jgi:uncharacterized membrane protein
VYLFFIGFIFLFIDQLLVKFIGSWQRTDNYARMAARSVMLLAILVVDNVADPGLDI